MIQNIFIFGATGKVGRALISQIFENRDTDPRIHKNPTRIVGIASSNRWIKNKSGLDEEKIRQFLGHPQGGVFYDSLDIVLGNVVCDFSDFGAECGLVFVDATNATEDMLHLHKQVIQGTDHGIVTANKLPLVLANFSTFTALTSRVGRYGFRCSVMAGAEAVNKIRDLRDLGDQITEISGCFSGTLGYIVSELEKERKFSQIVREAMSLGFTEPHPAEDLSGQDVARKIFILARTAGYDIRGDFFQLDPFVPAEYLKEKDVEKFIDNLAELDDCFARKCESAAKNNNVLRYVAVFDNSNHQPNIRVGLSEVPKHSPLGSLQGTRNKIVISTHNYLPNFYSVEAPGAGLVVTAQNMRRDLLDQLSHRIVNYTA